MRVLPLGRRVSLGRSFTLLDLLLTDEMKNLDLVRYFLFLRFYDSKNKYLEYILNVANG